MTRTSSPKRCAETARLRTRDVVWALAVTFAVLALIQACVGRMYLIPSSSMEPTLHGCPGCTNDRIVVQKVSYYFSDPRPGDVVVFSGPDSWNTSFNVDRSQNVMLRGLQNLGAVVGLVPNGDNILVKRVIATGGQTVSCEEGDPSVMVDGHATNQEVVLDPPEIPIDDRVGSQACGGAYFGPVTVPEGHLWVMGDNRTNSLDSRAHMGDKLQGTVPVGNVRGKVAAVVLPVSRAQLIGHPEL